MMILSFFVLLVTGAYSEKVRYDEYSLYSLYPSTLEESKAIIQLAHEYDVWKFARNLKDSSDVLVPPQKREEFESLLNNLEIVYEIKNENIQDLIDAEEASLKSRASTLDWKNYHELDAIYNWLDDLCRNYSFVTCIVGGKTFENRTIRGIEITFGKNLTGVFMESGIHAREWAGPASTTWMINELIRSPADSVLRKFNYLYFPVFNPDGYVYSWRKNRMWRKTRTTYKGHLGEKCDGADPNRNWDFHWNKVGASNDPCSEIYAGPKAFSEVETKTLSDYIKSVRTPKKLDIYLAYHTYGQMMLFPWGDVLTPAPNDAIWKKIGNAAEKAYEAVHGKKLEVGQGSTTIYPCSGASDDWFYGIFNVTISFTFEMRDTGKYGFLLPRDQIIPNGEEFYAAFKSVLTEYLKIRK